MKPIPYILSFLFIAAASMSWLRCSPSRVAGGGTIETTNGAVIGKVVFSSGGPADQTQVNLLPAGYDPVMHTGAAITDTTDTLGRYHFSRIDTGDYVVEAINLNGKTRFIRTGIHVAGDTISTPTDTLRSPGSVKIAPLAGAGAATGYVYIPGTTNFVFLNNRSEFVVLDSAPAGLLPAIVYSAGSGAGATAIRYGVRVISGDTTVVLNPSLKYMRRIFLNTTASGAGVAGDVARFPVLVRLNADNFNFSQARSNGADIRFTKGDNSSCAYEIERWDPVAELAEVWVKVDTVFGNDSEQSINMYWGDSAASPESASGGVFDTADGFQGVWHLGGAADDSVRDATNNRYHGISPDTARPSVTEGIIGNCREFDGKTDFITMPNTASGKLNFPQKGHYSVSAWVMADTFIGLQQTLVSKGKYQYFLWMDSTFWKFWEFQDRAGWESSAQQASLKNWVLLTGVRDGAAQRLYVNGESVDSLSLVSDLNPRNTTDDLIFGRARDLGTNSHLKAGFCNFKGKMDEVRIFSVAQTPDWVRLSYMNQRKDDKLVVFK